MKKLTALLIVLCLLLSSMALAEGMTDGTYEGSAEGAGFEESEHWYDHLERHIGWRGLGKVLCGYVTQPGDIEGKPELEQACKLGSSIR